MPLQKAPKRLSTVRLVASIKEAYSMFLVLSSKLQNRLFTLTKGKKYSRNISMPKRNEGNQKMGWVSHYCLTPSGPSISRWGPQVNRHINIILKVHWTDNETQDKCETIYTMMEFRGNTDGSEAPRQSSGQSSTLLVKHKASTSLFHASLSDQASWLHARLVRVFHLDFNY